MLSRRRTLGLVVAGSLGGFAGCLSPGGALSMTPVETETAIGNAATETVDPERRPDVATLLDAARSKGVVDVDGECAVRARYSSVVLNSTSSPVSLSSTFETSSS